MENVQDPVKTQNPDPAKAALDQLISNKDFQNLSVKGKRASLEAYANRYSPANDQTGYDQFLNDLYDKYATETGVKKKLRTRTGTLFQRAIQSLRKIFGKQQESTQTAQRVQS